MIHVLNLYTSGIHINGSVLRDISLGEGQEQCSCSIWSLVKPKSPYCKGNSLMLSSMWLNCFWVPIHIWSSFPLSQEQVCQVSAYINAYIAFSPLSCKALKTFQTTEKAANEPSSALLKCKFDIQKSTGPTILNTHESLEQACM